ncbi:MAG: DUF4302 domain-containing protein [Bacteroidota bacterium]
MKKLLFFMVALSIMIGCKKASYVAKFDESPQKRAADQINLVSTKLTSSPNGWIATLPTGAGGGYSFYMNFDNNQNVIMYGDMTDKSASEEGKSYYRVKQDMGTDLVFDTYNYISMLNDPDQNVLGGASKLGFNSDNDFIYDRSSSDSIVFIGKKFRQPFKLIKATAAQKASYEAAGLKIAIDKFKAFFVANQNPYIEMASGTKTLQVGLSINATNNLGLGKRTTFLGVIADGVTTKSSSQKFAFTLEGASILNSGLTFEGTTFVKYAWKDANTLALYDLTGKEFIVKNSVAPLVPIDLLWGVKYSQMFSAYKTIYPGTSTSGASILNYFHNNVTSRPLTGFDFVAGDITFVWDRVNKRLTTNARVAQAANPAGGWVTATVYDYTMDANNVYTFKIRSAASGGYATNIIVQMQQFLLNNRVAFDFYVNGADLFGKMKSVNDPGIEMTFVLR